MEAEFYDKRSGTKEVEELFSQARSQAESFMKVLNEYSRFNLAQKRLKELQPQLDEQSRKVEGLRKELEKVGKKKNQEHQADAVREKFMLERAAHYELAMSVGLLKGVERPVIPEWLVSFLKVSGNV